MPRYSRAHLRVVLGKLGTEGKKKILELFPKAKFLAQHPNVGSLKVKILVRI